MITDAILFLYLIACSIFDATLGAKMLPSHPIIAFAVGGMLPVIISAIYAILHL